MTGVYTVSTGTAAGHTVPSSRAGPSCGALPLLPQPAPALLHSSRRAVCAAQGSQSLVVPNAKAPGNPRTWHRDTRKVACASSVAMGGEDGAHRRGALLETLLLGSLFGAWYLANIVFNIYNKEVLKVFPMPITCTTVQFLVGSTLAITCWATGFVKRPNITWDTLISVVPLAVAHTLGNLLTNISLGAVAVSFTHTIKALEPFFSVLLCSVFLNDRPHPLVLLTLIPIMGGVAMASVSEATFNWKGFLSAMGSNLTFQSRNVLSKKTMIKKGGCELDNVNLFATITILSSLLLLPVSLLLEGWMLTPTGLAEMGVQNSKDIIMKAIIAGGCFHAYQQVSYMILARVSPVTHSIGNSVKRVVVIVASVLFFKNTMTMQSAAGTAIALAGVTAYSLVKRSTMAKKKAV